MTKAAGGGMPEAEIVLADWYYFGQPGIDIDYTKAFEFYSHAAERENPVAQNALGSIYYNGLGQTRDRKKGVESSGRQPSRGWQGLRSTLPRNTSWEKRSGMIRSRL